MLLDLFPCHVSGAIPSALVCQPITARSVVRLRKDLVGQIQDTGIVQRYHTTIRSSLQVHAHALSFVVIEPSEVVPYGLHVQVQFAGDAMDAAVWKAVLDAAQFVE